MRERSFDEATGKGKTRLRFEEHDKPPGFKDKHSPLSRPAQEAGKPPQEAAPDLAAEPTVINPTAAKGGSRHEAQHIPLGRNAL